MTWLRSNIRRVSHVALFALAIQFALSFGHFHGVVADAASVQVERSAPQPASDHDQGEHPGDICAICVVMAMANTALHATPPAAPVLPQTISFVYTPAAAEPVRVASARVAFQPRGPPVSRHSFEYPSATRRSDARLIEG
jgi:hypothetical protein